MASYNETPTDSMEEPKNMCCNGKSLITCQYISSAIFMITGSILIAVSIVWHFYTEPYNFLIDPDICASVYSLLGLAAFIVLIGFMSIFAGMTQNYCLLMTNSILMTISLLGKGVAGIILLVYGTDSSLFIGRSLAKGLIECDQSSQFFDIFNTFQNELQCCGVAGPNDYHYYMRCYQQLTNCYIAYRSIGCVEPIAAIISYYSSIVGGIAVATLIPEIFGCFVGFTLTMWVRKQI